MIKRIPNYFLRGLLYTVPISVTIFLIWQLLTVLDGVFNFKYPGLGLLLILALITLIGFLGSNFLSQQVFGLFERVIKKAPLVSIIYTAVKDLLDAFVGNKKSFSKPVLVKLYENSEIVRLGFITNLNFESLGKTDRLLTVYLPHSYNISGNMYLVPERYVTRLNISATETMKYTMSGGVTDLGEITEENFIDSQNSGEKHTP